MPTTSTHGLPVPLVSESPNGPAQIGALAASLDSQLLTTVTSLPGSPVDGQRALYLADAAEGIVWDLRYRSASPNAQKWEYIGGSAMRASKTTDGTGTGTDIDLSDGAGPQITIPRPGVYDVEVLAEMLDNTAETGVLVMLKVNGSTVETASNSGADGLKQMSIMKRVTVATAGHVVKVTYGATGGANFVFGRHRELKITPIRLG